ncbi:MAG: beta-ketoacyl-ACP synthase II [Clostridiaceae bacterium]|nr:beta-ketoacyl-ACP synthase II [Clostridiaceae bacterium]
MRVAVTGLGALTPIGNDVSTFWNAAVEGVCGIAPITRFDTADMKYKLAAELRGFDPLDRLDRQIVRRTDLFTQYALFAAGEAIADAELEGKVDEDMFGVVFGSGVGGFETFCEEHEHLLTGGPRRVAPLFIPKMITNIAAGNLAIRYHAHGTCFAVVTACATGTSAVGEAYRLIRDGEQTAILCGGSEAVIAKLSVAGFGNCQALSASDNPDAASLPFDARRAGFVMGEGAGALVLEEYTHAVRRGAKIYAEVVGYGSTCDAHHVTAPDPEARSSARAVSIAAKALANVDPARIYINAHGTGTELNDKTETAAYKRAFDDAAYRLHISSTKSMTGHMLGAAGAVEAIAAILALRDGVVPPTIHLDVPDPACDLHYTPNVALRTPLDAALSVSLGFGGHNACVAFIRAEN